MNAEATSVPWHSPRCKPSPPKSRPTHCAATGRCAIRSISIRWTGSTSCSACTRSCKVDIPEADYARLVTLDDVVSYLQKKLDPGA